jgi:CheY-like chemotaxis protein
MPDAMPGPGAPKSCRRILLIEDDDDIRDALMSLLEDEGYDVRGAANGKEGLDVLGTMERPCIILLDLMMPVMSGPEFLSHLREEDVVAPIPVVVVSAWPKEAERLGNVQGFVKKPVDLPVLLQLIDQYCHVGALR